MMSKNIIIAGLKIKNKLILDKIRCLKQYVFGTMSPIQCKIILGHYVTKHTHTFFFFI